MARESNTGLGVSQIYGTRETGGAVGQLPTSGATRELSIQFTGEVLDDAYLTPVSIPAGSVITKAYVLVTEAFDLATSSSVEVGELGDEATNGVVMTEANLESEGYVDLTTALAGTFDAEAPLASATTLGVSFSAGSVTDNSVGKATLVLEYVKVN